MATAKQTATTFPSNDTPDRVPPDFRSWSITLREINVGGMGYNWTMNRGEQMVTIEKLIELGVLRKSMFSNLDNEWYVIYTEKGAVDISLSELTAE